MGMRAEKMQDMVGITPEQIEIARRKKKFREAAEKKAKAKDAAAQANDSDATLARIEDWTKQQ